MEDANPISIPADPNHELSALVQAGASDELTTAPYREAVGSLMYLSVATRPDIIFAVNQASRYLEKPTTTHWEGVKRILKYLKGTIDYALQYECGQEKELLAYSDADYAGDIQTRRSTTGYALKFASGTISWNSQRQQSVDAVNSTSVEALSTTDSEYMAACQTAKQTVWVQRLIKELLVVTSIKTTLLLDNQSATCLIKNPVSHKRVKHIDVRFHYVRERYEERAFELQYTSSKEQHADILTKALPRQLHAYHLKALGVLEKRKSRERED